MTLYLVLFDNEGADETGLREQLVHFPLRPDLYLVESDQDTSKLYHFVKRRLRGDAALLVAPLRDDPKFKEMAPGALKWVRARRGRAGPKPKP